jgi:hypothetical protein
LVRVHAAGAEFDLQVLTGGVAELLQFVFKGCVQRRFSTVHEADAWHARLCQAANPSGHRKHGD